MFTSFRDWIRLQVLKVAEDTIETKNEKMDEQQSLIKEDTTADKVIFARTPQRQDEDTILTTTNKSDCDHKWTKSKSFGNLLYLAINEVKTAISDVGVKFKEVLEQQTDILGEFNREQERFLKLRQSNTLNFYPPWLGCINEDVIKEQCLHLSNDKRNFIHNPPAGITFEFDYEVSYPVAVTIMEQDPNLVQMRFELVPKVVSEKNFWRNYFYRVSIICRANELPIQYKPVDCKASNFLTNDVKDSTADQLMVDILDDDYLLETQNSVDHLLSNCDEEWEKELEAELRNYELLDEDKPLSSKINMCE